MKIFLFVFFAILSANKVFADNEICGNTVYYGGEFEPIIYNCAPGTYLPAGAISCEQCPNNHTCNGGTFAFDANHTQGLEYGDVLVVDAIGSCSNEFARILSVTFEPINYGCPAGYYLPAGMNWVNDYEGCRKCPLNHYCGGGTYTYNETTTQGINECPSALPFAPMGSPVCYPHILHVGDDVVYLRSTKQTTPSLNIKIDNIVYYANMTTVPTMMNSETEHYLKIQYDNQIYYVCDDTTYAVAE